MTLHYMELWWIARKVFRTSGDVALLEGSVAYAAHQAAIQRTLRSAFTSLWEVADEDDDYHDLPWQDSDLTGASAGADGEDEEDDEEMQRALLESDADGSGMVGLIDGAIEAASSGEVPPSSSKVSRYSVAEGDRIDGGIVGYFKMQNS